MPIAARGHRQWQPTQVVAIERENIESIELHLIVMLAGVERIEVGDTVDAQHHGLAIDDELPVPVLQRGFHDPRVSADPVASARGEPYAFPSRSSRMR